MSKKSLAERFPMLKEAWDKYGFAAEWDKHVKDVKIRSDACYAVVWFHDPNGNYDTVADFARGKADAAWEVQNDGEDEITEAQWKKLRIVPECDWYEIKE